MNHTILYIYILYIYIKNHKIVSCKSIVARKQRSSHPKSVLNWVVCSIRWVSDFQHLTHREVLKQRRGLGWRPVQCRIHVASKMEGWWTGTRANPFWHWSKRTKVRHIILVVVCSSTVKMSGNMRKLVDAALAVAIWKGQLCHKHPGSSSRESEWEPGDYRTSWSSHLLVGLA